MKYCSKWNLRHNFNRTQFMVFQKQKNWKSKDWGDMHNQIQKVLKKIYLFWGRAGKFKRIEEIKPKYKSQRHINIKSSF
jgi:ADP-heptose:LPS heptosyltransferase